MTDRPEPKDPAEMLKKHFATMQVPDGTVPRLVLSERNRRKLEKIRMRVRQLRGEK